ncbi:MAG: sulfite exporter TauE/SafE family protein [Burkholderiales bacterium]|nr:sulfite exporter TauE/SafE family protein [Anaerolineae bacterium]
MQFIIVIAFVSLMIGLSKGGLGAVVVAGITPVLTLIMPVQEAVVVVIPMLLIGDAIAMWMYWGAWEIRYVKLLLPMAVVGIVVGTYFLTSLPDSTLRHILGAFTLLVVGYKLVVDRIQSISYEPRNWHGYLAGAASGFGSALANTGAPPFTSYMLLQNLNPRVFIGTTTLFFALVNIVKLFVQGTLIDVPRVLSIAWAIPIIPIGAWLGRKLILRLNQRTFEWMMMIALVWIGLMLLLSSPN